MNTIKRYFVRFLQALGFPLVLVEGFVELECRDKDGNLLWTKAFQNGITNAGKAAIAGLVGNTGAITAFSYIALGTGTTAFAASQTALVTELSTLGLSRAASTVSRVTTTVTNDTVQFQKVFTVSGGSTTVQEIGVFNASSSGIMLGRALTPPTALNDQETLTATYKVVFS